MGFDDFKALASSNDPGDRELHDDLRQKAKPVNFGIPGGLGAPALVAYALANYGVEMTLEEARQFRDRLINEVYPELALYLADDGMESLARNLGSSVEACWERLDWQGDRSGAVVGGTRNVVAGKLVKADGRPYHKRYLDGVWSGLIALNRNPELAPLLEMRQGGGELRDRLFRAGVTTLTGRVRGRVGFTQARNTPFQGLAADGAKLALYELIRADYRVVAFVHDEVVVELPEDADHAAEARRVESIMNRAMEMVTGNVPVAVEFALSRRWSKRAKAVFDPEGRLIRCEID
jgi:DNA polymerase family A